MKRENMNFNKLVAWVIMLSTILAVCFANPNQVKADYPFVSVFCDRVGTDYVLKLISDINRDRTSGGAYYVKNDVKVPVKAGALINSYDMQKIAELRAAEIFVYQSYTRPNGEPFNTATNSRRTSNVTSDFERFFISDKLLNGQEIYDRWFNWGTAESAEFLMSDFYKTIGVACLKYENKYCYVLELSHTNVVNPTTIEDGSLGYAISYDPTLVPLTYKMSVSEKNLTTGSQSSFNPSLYGYRGYVKDNDVVGTTGVSYKLSCADSSVVIDNRNLIVAKKPGRFKIKISFYYNGNLFFADDTYINVTARNINEFGVSITNKFVEYTGSSVIPKIKVSYGDYYYTEGVDYKLVNPKNNINANSDQNTNASVEIQGLNGLTGTKVIEYTIDKAPLPKATSVSSPVYNGKEQMPTIKIVFNGKTLVEDKDYTVYSSSSGAAGDHWCTLIGIGNFRNSISVPYTILPYTIKDSQVGTISNQLYRGVGISPEVKIVANNQTLKNGVDYTISYSNNINVGTATATITFKGNYTSEKPIVRNFQIVTPTPIATPKPTATPIPTATPKPTVTPTATATPKPTATPIATPTVTVAPSVTSKPEATPVVTVKPTAVATPIATPIVTVAPSVTGKPEVTPVVTVKPTATTVPKPTTTVAPTVTSKPEATPVVTDKPTATTVPKPTTTVAPSVTSKPEATPVVTDKPTATAVPTNEPTVTPTFKPTIAPTKAPVATATPVPTIIPTVVATPAPTETVTPVLTTTATPTAVPTEDVTATPTAAPTEEPTVEPTKAPSVEDFAERLYTTCLGREAEEAGKDYWTSELKGGKTGAEVAEGFFFSPEYEGRNLNNEEFIGTLYETFMGRTPADDEVAYWSSEMENGKDRKFIFDGFVNSPEWANICLTYGIRSGGLASPTFEKEASDKVKAFAERLYTTCLGREAEKEGLEWWAAELANLRQTGTVAASGFFYSPEFLGLNTSDDEYVTRLYRTFMGREPEEAGFEFWTSELKSGKDRQYVFDGFSAASEFADLCADAGIMR